MVTSHDEHFWNALENHDEEIISIFKAIETDCRTNVFVLTRDHAAAKDCFRARQMSEASGDLPATEGFHYGERRIVLFQGVKHCAFQG